MIPSLIKNHPNGSSQVLKRWAEVQDILKLTKDGARCALRGGFVWEISRSKLVGIYSGI